LSVPIALTIAGSDSSGGAGIQADLKSFAALGVYGASAITALTAQNTMGVTAIHDVPPEMVIAQIDAVFSDLDVKAVKIGMVSQPATIRAIVASLDRWKPAHVVVDPVMVATSGAKLLSPEATDLLRETLIPRASVLTPNMPEAAALLEQGEAVSEDEMIVQGQKLLALGCKAVLVKGGHGGGAESVDVLVTTDKVVKFSSSRIATRNTHGTGCSLSSAIAAGLARGHDLESAVREAKAFVTSAIAGADTLGVGRGHGPIDHFYMLPGLPTTRTSI
jgi:hydroxymethylpyrimidine/phosphomethylpyrimidine kinase